MRGVPVSTTTPFDPADHFDRLNRETFTEWVPVEKMFVDKYARPVGQRQINRILNAGVDPDKFGVIMLSMRHDGFYAILDGNHRVQVARACGITEMLSRIFIDKTYQEEAEMFVTFNTINRPTALDKFRARLEANEPQAHDIVDILSHYDLAVALNGPAVGHLQAIHVLDLIYLTQGLAGLDSVVRVVYRAWQTERRAWHGHLLMGVAQFLFRYRTEINETTLVDRMKQTLPERLMAEAGITSPGLKSSPGTLIGQTILHRYNAGRRANNRLSEWVNHPGLPSDTKATRPAWPSGVDLNRRVPAPTDL